LALQLRCRDNLGLAAIGPMHSAKFDGAGGDRGSPATVRRAPPRSPPDLSDPDAVPAASLVDGAS
jgi:hypothetical protein